MTPSFHDASHQDMENLIFKLARHWAGRIGLSWDNHGQDLVQTGWLSTVRVAKEYSPRGFKFITYAYLSINRDIRRAATRIAVNERTVTHMDTAHDPQAFDDETSPTSGLRTIRDQRGRDADYQLMLRELLSTPDGQELLAAELGYTDKSKIGTRIRKEQLVALKARYERLSEAA